MSIYKLIYFNLRGRGEVARLIFTYAGQEFEDYRVKSKDWPNYKPTTPTGKLPILEIKDENDTVRLVQSRAICRYLANKFNLAGKTDLERAKVDEVVDQINDEMDMLGRVNMEIHDPDEKIKEFQRILTQVVPSNLKYFNKILSGSSSGFLVSNELTWADLSLMNKWDLLPESAEAFFEEYPLLKQHDAKIRSLPQLAKWLNKRPNSKI